ncbi:hypothetical protein [Pontibacter sp. HSC-36F09]|uniref:hypothetical protein n=1 Tax=Pontibacter sp. HSC-36F09 TaxID=2910966 RepID=UPI00209F2637|nr:hypothetical protein [Pontibacter sp. HSC-36F09]MCP2043968.1 hypothetical protein [Pontibacter sp. HSC-36F09]
MGEYALEHWLKSRGYTYQVDRAGYENRNSDAFDFLVASTKIDVKVAKKSIDRLPNDNCTHGYPQ